MKLLVTGGGGMVGRNVLGHPGMAAYELLAPGSRELDLRDPVATGAYLDQHRPDAIIHLAAIVGGIQANIDEPVRFLAANSLMALSLFEQARRLGIKTILNIASSCMYPRNIENTLTTDLILTAPLEPTNEGYALSKIMGAKLLEYMVREDSSLHYRTILPCNLYGLYDHFDLRKSHLVPAAIMKMVDAVDTGARDVSVWGDGTARREFMFATDLADFIIWALPRLSSLPLYLNVGLGRDWSVRDYYETIAKIVGFDGQLVFDPTKPAGMKRKLLNVDDVHRLGWRAATSLEHGLAQTIAHYRAIKAA